MSNNVEKGNGDVLVAGKGKAFLFPQAGLMASFGHLRLILFVVAGLLIASVCGNILLSYFYIRREVWVFVKNDLGEVIQADKDSFLKGNMRRDDNELKGFALRFCRDVFEFSPLDVRSRLEYGLKFVESNSQALVSDGLRLTERSRFSQSGLSVKIEDDPDRGKVPEMSISSRQPLEVFLIFGRVTINPRGQTETLQPISVRVRLREIPRSPYNPNGLVVVGLSSTIT